MNIDPADITVDDLNTALYKLVTAHPDRSNPMHGGECMYRLVEDDGTVSHCIVGQVLADWGIDTSADDEGLPASTVLMRLGFSDDVADRANKIQTHADHGGPGPNRWGRLVEAGIVGP